MKPTAADSLSLTRSYQPSSGEAIPLPPPGLNDILNNPDSRKFSTQDLQSLIRSSQAEHSQSIGDFVENGAGVPNSDLRKVATALESHQISEPTAELLRDLYLQTSCEDRYAFRLYFARPEVSEKLTTRGTRITDFGVQSASIHLPHAENWQLEHPAEATEKFIFVLDKNVPKQNISTGFLLDHVVVMPGEVLEVSDVAELSGTTYVMLKAAQMQGDQPVYSPFDGTAYVNLPAKKNYLTSFQPPK